MISVNKEFRVHRLNATGMAKAEYLAEVFDGALTNILKTVAPAPSSSSQTPPNGREIALVRTHLELASFYAKKAMAQLPENQEGA